MKNEKISRNNLLQVVIKYKSLGLFVLGLLIDLLSLGRIDRLIYLFQHAFYLGIIFFLFIKFYPSQMRTALFRWKNIGFAPIDLMQFFYGSLLSHYFYFYFRSSNFFTWVFLILITLFLLLNELAYEKKWYLSFKIILFPFCTLAYLIYLIPIWVGSLGVSEFYISLILFFILMTLLPYLFIADKNLSKKIWLASFIVLLVTLFCYQTRLLPPVPLHVTKSGVFTQRDVQDNTLWMSVLTVKKIKKQYIAYQDSKKIFYVSRIFSPSNFRDKLYLEWRKKQDDSWFLQDRIIFEITGKEDGDYRGIAWKENWGIGQYQVSLVSEDNRVLDTIFLEVLDETQRRDWDHLVVDF
jgi:hypothetical protein